MNIFVAKLNPQTTPEQLRELFEHYGRVDSTKVIFDRETGNSKGYGFVEMPEDREALEAIGELNGKEFMGKVIVVKTSQPKEAAPPRRDHPPRFRR